MSTGVGKGFAILHAKTNSIKIIVAFAKIDNQLIWALMNNLLT